jgi:ATP-dependent protease ClpP protease subunit
MQEEIQIPIQFPMGDGEVYGQNHSLFIVDKPRVMNPLRDEEGNIVEGYFEEDGGYKIYKLFLGNFNESGNGMQRIINKLQNSEPDDILELHIASDGGNVDELIQLYNICNTLFYNRVTTFANHAYSAGAWAFLLGNDRVLYDHSSLMWHSYSTGMGGKRQDLLDRIEHEDKRLEVFLMGTLTKYFSKKEIRKMNKGKDFWLTTKDACERGIATHVMKDGEVYTNEEYLDLIDPKKIKKRKKEAKKAKKEAKKAEKTNKDKKDINTPLNIL